MEAEDAVTAVCRIGRKIEEDLAIAEKEARERGSGCPCGARSATGKVVRVVRRSSVAWGLLPTVLLRRQPANGKATGRGERT